MQCLSKYQRNEIFHALAAGRLNPAECEMRNESDFFQIDHNPTCSWFALEQSRPDGHFDGEYKSSQNVGDEVSSKTFPASFSDKLNSVRAWAEEVVSWRETPDLWELRHNWAPLTDPQHQDSPNTPFRPEEQKAISAQLRVIRETVAKTYELTAEQEERIANRFDEAEKAAKRLGRKDWILLFAGGIFSLILADCITPDIAQHILMMAVHGVGHLFSGTLRSLPGHAENR